MDKKYVICCIALGIIVSTAFCTANAEQNTDGETTQEAQTVYIKDEETISAGHDSISADISATKENVSVSATDINSNTVKQAEGEVVSDTDTGNNQVENENETSDTVEKITEADESDSEEDSDAESNQASDNEEQDETENDEDGQDATDKPKEPKNENSDDKMEDEETEGKKSEESLYDISWYNEEETAFTISNERQMRGFMMLVNGLTIEYDEPVSFEGKRLDMDDHIALGSGVWTPIGQETNPFAGVFNGNMYTVSELQVDASTEMYGGLFGYITGRIENLNIVNANIKGGEANGTVAGYAAEESVISNVTVSGDVSDGDNNGGITGITYGTIENSINNSNIIADVYAGGITGILGTGGVLTDCQSYKTVLESNVVEVQSNTYAGGIAGMSNGHIISCVNNSIVDAAVTGGGICARAENSRITKSYSTANVHASQLYAGGIAGEGENTDISYCYVLKKPLCDDGVAGGIAASLSGSNITKSFTYFEWTDEDDVAPIVTLNTNNNISYCYYLAKEVSENPTDGGKPSVPPEDGDEESQDERDNDSDTEEVVISDGEKEEDDLDYTSITEEVDKIAFENGRLAWLLNTLGNTTSNEMMWGSNGKYPVFADIQYKPVFKINPVYNEEGGSISVASEYCSEGSSVIIKLSSEFKYKLADLWVRYENTKTELDIPARPYTFVMPKEDVTIYAVFEPIKNNADKSNENNENADAKTKYTVIFDACGGLFYANTDKECETIEKTITVGRKVSAPVAPTMEGYLFDGWYTDRKGNTEYDFDESVSDDLTLYAVYASVEEYTVTFDINGGAGSTPQSQTVKSGKLVKDPGAVQWEDNSKVFNGWSTSPNKTSAAWNFQKDTMPNKDIVLYALWLDNDTDFSGSGTHSSPYVIKSENDFQMLSNKIKAGESYSGRHFRLESDVICNSSIGTQAHPFMGIFDGGGHTITLSIDNNSDYSGLFGYTRQAEIYSVNVEGNINGKNYVGGIVGYSDDSTIADCVSYAKVTASGSYAGGIVGYGSAQNSENHGEVSAEQYVGGIAGYVTSDTMGCKNSGKISCAKGYVGGIAGDASDYSFTECTNSGKVVCANGSGGDENAYTGGIAGILKNADNCENTGVIEGSARTGGIAGRIIGKANQCTNRSNVTGTVRVGGIAGSAALGSTISYCDVSASLIKALRSYAGGVCGESESNSAIEYSFCTSDVTADGSYCTGISAKGGTIKNSFYYCEENISCPVANNADIYASYCLNNSSEYDDDFRAPEKSYSAFNEGRVSWLLNTDGGGEFSKNGNSLMWTTENSIPVQAHNQDGTIAVIAQNGTTGNEILINGSSMFFCHKGDTVEISYRKNDESSLDYIEIKDYWIHERIVKKLIEAEIGEENITVMADYAIDSNFIKALEEENEEDNPKTDDGKNNVKDNSNDDKEKNPSSRKRNRRSENENNGQSTFGSTDGDSNANGTGGGSGGGIGTGTGTGSGGMISNGGGKSTSGGVNANSATSSQEFDMIGASNLDAAQTKADENGEFLYETNNSNIISENGTGVSDVSVSFSQDVSQENGESIDISAVETMANDNVSDNSGFSEMAGRSNDVSAGSEKNVSKIRLDKLVPVAPSEQTDKRAGIMTILAMLAGFLFNTFFDRNKKNSRS